MSDELPESKRYELQQIADKSKLTYALLGLFLPPLAYYMVGKTGAAILNILTANWFLLGFFISPLHIAKIVGDAQSELEAHGVSY
ncbi:hypothetical protein [Salinibaculum rarum]|uniref:hypothetical protein n=1 Tax=Salinibaculum rarum TaxID=3058903 RepID=UPI00265DF875|nr:hypothetical protein [Salinibaculum sp. KK48]